MQFQFDNTSIDSKVVCTEGHCTEQDIMNAETIAVRILLTSMDSQLDLTESTIQWGHDSDNKSKHGAKSSRGSN